jgi:hypothetical protein
MLDRLCIRPPLFPFDLSQRNPKKIEASEGDLQRVERHNRAHGQKVNF